VRSGDFADRVLLARRIVVCVGCGGVGKTTVAAALALEAARRGRRALVLTIDPARRLADALGVEALGNQPQRIPGELLAGLGVPEGGELSALMLDMKRTFDDLVERFAESEEARDRGSVEYSAMEKVYEMWERDEYDLIVVDTPPAQHALDFLDAPQRLLEFLESRLVQMLIHPAFAAGRFGFRLFQQGTRRVLHVLERVSGLAFLEDVSEFLLAFEGMSVGFRERATRVRTLLMGPESSFVLVTGTGRDAIQQATQFRDRLEATGVGLAGVLVNRVRLWPDGEPPPVLEREAAPAAEDLAALAAALAGACGPELPAEQAARAALDAAKGYAALVRRDARATSALREQAQGQGRFWGQIPELPDDVHDLPGLARIARAIFGKEEPDGSQAA
jgi:anion-transporting  ArsA/GET3 family ATPase